MTVHNHNPIVQVAYIVESVPEAVKLWTTVMGAGPFFFAPHFPITSANHFGEEATFDHSPAFGQWGPLQVELIELHSATPPALHTALGGGKPALHHMTWFAPDVDAETERLEALGWPRVFDMMGGTGTRAVFHDATADLGHLIELYAPSPQLLAHYNAVARAAEGWDGSDPLRPIEALAAFKTGV